jgi:phage terminase large subunit
MTTPAVLERLGIVVGELVADHSSRARTAVDTTQYRGRIVAFAREVLHVETLYAKQVAALESFVTDKYTTVFGAHGAGKDYLLAIAALYAAYVSQQLTLCISATERQLLGQVWRELTTLFNGSSLPGRLYTSALEIAGERRIVAMTSGSTNNLTGWHHAHGVAVLISESQAEQVEAAAFDAAVANTVSEGSRVLVVGNPITPAGRFYEICHKPHWSKIQISAFDHPNVAEGRMVIAGGPTAAWPSEVAAEYGVDSPYYQARVLGIFPTAGVFDALIDRASIDRAFARFTDPAFHMRANDARRRIAADIGRSTNGDPTCVCIARGPLVESFELRHEPDLMKTATYLHQKALELGRLEIMHARVTDEQIFAARAKITTDDAGVGGGCTDRLRELGARVTPFLGAAAPSSPANAARFLNLRAETYFALRERLLRNTIAIVPDEAMAQELLATSYSLTAAGKIAIEPKDSIRSKLGRSPDRADALSMLCMPTREARIGHYRLDHAGLTIIPD